MSPKPQLSSPAGITIERHEDYIHIVEGLSGWPRLTACGFMAVFTCIVWYGCIDKIWALIHAPAFWLKSTAILPLALGLLISYITLAFWKNKTHIWVSTSIIEVYQAPLWMPGHKRIDAKKVEQLYVRHTNPAQGGSRTEVRAKLKSRADIRVAKVAYPIEHAQYIEREIETFLELSDRAVVGEHASET